MHSSISFMARNSFSLHLILLEATQDAKLTFGGEQQVATFSGDYNILSAVACVGVVIAVMDVSVAGEYLSGHCLVTLDMRLMLHEQHAEWTHFKDVIRHAWRIFFKIIAKLQIGSEYL